MDAYSSIKLFPAKYIVNLWEFVYKSNYETIRILDLNAQTLRSLVVSLLGYVFYTFNFEALFSGLKHVFKSYFNPFPVFDRERGRGGDRYMNRKMKL